MFTFLHAADIHLDSPLRGLERYEGAPVEEIRSATRRALENLVDLALERQVAFVLLAGDLYDGDWQDYNTGLYFVKQMMRLSAVEIPVIAISGNHDAANKMTRTLRLPPGFEMLSGTRPESVDSGRLQDLGVVVHGRSFAKSAELENLAQGYPPARSGLFNIGLLHTSLTGAEGHEPYAPCSLDDLRAKAYDYWALGHVHERRVVCGDPPVVYPGNLQGRHIRETGAKGCYLVNVGDDGRTDPEFHALDVFRWERCKVSAAGVESLDSLLERVNGEISKQMERHDGRPLAVRVEIEGPCTLHEMLVADPIDWLNQVRAAAMQAGGAVWIEKVVDKTVPERRMAPEALADGPLGELTCLIQELCGEADDGAETRAGLDALAEELKELNRKLRAASVLGEGVPRLDDPDWIRGVLVDVEKLLMVRLQKEGGR